MKRIHAHTEIAAAGDKWVQVTMTGELISLVETEWLDVLKVDRLAQSLDHLRKRRGIQGSSDHSIAQYQALVALHCVHFNEMSWPTRAGLPAALLRYFGLDRETGPLLLGIEGWWRVEECFGRKANGEFE